MIKEILLSLGLLIPGLLFAQSATKPQFKVGDKWEWQTSDYLTKLPTSKSKLEVTEVGDRIAVRSGSDAASSVYWDSEGRLLENTKTGRKFTHLFPTPWPLEVGKTWKYEYEWVNSGWKGKTSQTAEVLSFEEVTTPAGTFKAYKVEYYGYFTNFTLSMNGKEKVISWYVPELRTRVKTVYESPFDKTVTELISYDVK